MTQARKAEIFRQLHYGPDVLLLANVWDCFSARVVELAGYPAIATSSAGVAFALGYADGQRIPMQEMAAAVGRIARLVEVPVTADLEGGYDDIGATAAALIDSGAVGLNLEDVETGDIRTLVPVDRQCDKIRALRRIGSARGVEIVVNARTDVFLAQIGEPGSRFEHAVERLGAYIGAGADCVFVPGVADEATIVRLVETLRCPLNVLAVAGTPPVARLKELGVRRVSVGSGLARSAIGHARRVAEAIRDSGGFDAMLESAIPYAEANRMFEKAQTA